MMKRYGYHESIKSAAIFCRWLNESEAMTDSMLWLGKFCWEQMIGLDWHSDPSNDILPELVGHSDSQYMVYETWLSVSGVKWVTVSLMSYMIYRLLRVSLVWWVQWA